MPIITYYHHLIMLLFSEMSHRKCRTFSMNSFVQYISIPDKKRKIKPIFKNEAKKIRK